MKKVARCALPVLVLGFAIARAADLPVFKIGAGLGNGFGYGVGIGLEMETPDVALLVGYGDASADKAGWDVGARYYFRPRGKKFRPSITASYAPTEILGYGSEALAFEKKALVYGLNILGGFDQDVGIPGGFVFSYGFGLGYPSYSEPVRRDFERAGKELPARSVKLAFSLGIKYQL